MTSFGEEWVFEGNLLIVWYKWLFKIAYDCEIRRVRN